LYALISVGVAFAIIYFTGIKAEARIYASFFASATLTLPLIRRYLKPKIPRGKEMRKYLIKLSLPLLPSALSTALIAQLDKLMIERLGGTAALGKYSIAYSVGFMLTTLTAALYSALQPWLMRKLNSGNTDAARAITEKIIFLTALGLLVFLLLIPEIFKIIAAEAYRDAEIAVYPLAAAGYLQFISNLLAANIIHTEKTLAISVSGLIAFAFNLVTNLFLIPRFSYPAAAITTAISYLILVFLEYFYLKRRSPLKIADKKTLTPLWLILFALPVYFLREIFISRFIFAIAVILSALPTLIKFIRAFLERRGESETN
jgi:O-antigen/teichoic acid export membrane protein